MSAAQPDIVGAFVAKQRMDKQLCQALVMMTGTPGSAPAEITGPVHDYVTARINLARRELDAFETALKGGR